MARSSHEQRTRGRASSDRSRGATTPVISMLIAGIVAVAALDAPAAANTPTAPAQNSPETATQQHAVQQPSTPERTVLTDEHGAWLATFTRGTRTVTLAGPARTFSEADVTATVTTTTWVRLLPAPFDGSVDEGWLHAARNDTTADVLATAMQYIHNAPPIRSSSGQRLAGDAHYGPIQPDGTRAEGSDFNDYLGVRWTYDSVVDRPERDQLESLDCSGFVRMVYGFRSGVPLSLEPTGATLPRRSYEILDDGPGVLTIPYTGARPASLADLAPGDLVFFDASGDDGTQIDHIGIYLGLDQRGNNRFISSRKSIDGPTLGDHRGRSTLNGDGLYGQSFRAARRL